MSTAYAAQPAAAFGVVSAIDQVSSGRFDAELSPDWMIGRKPTGSYLLSMLGRAAVSTSGHHYVNGASAHYLRPEPGPRRCMPSGASGRFEQSGAGAVGPRLARCVEALLPTSDLTP